jgi:glycosyltransferase involved in cell wall biosynthesis
VKAVRLIYVTAAFPTGDREAFFVPEVRELLRLGHEVLVVPTRPRRPVLDRYVLENRTICRGVLSSAVLGGALASSFARPADCARQLSRVLEWRRPAIACKNAAVFPKALWLARLASRWRADHIHAQWAGTSATLAMIAGGLTSTPWSFTAHRWDIVEDNLLERKVESAAFVRFISRDGLRMAVARCSGRPPGRGIVLHMGVDVPAIGRSCLRQEPPTVILCVAHLVPLKGHAYLFEAATLLKDRGRRVELLLAGDGPIRRGLKRLAERLGIASQTIFLGEVPHETLMEFYSEGRVTMTVLPSLTEGVPVSLIEAMSYGVPVIATAVGGVSELVGEGAGVLVCPRRSEELADRIEFLATNLEERILLGERGRKRIESGFDVRRIVPRLAGCLESGPAFCSQGILSAETATVRNEDRNPDTVL